eukprot:6227179-Alexandrium_andersonii.AAC.1
MEARLVQIAMDCQGTSREHAAHWHAFTVLQQPGTKRPRAFAGARGASARAGATALNEFLLAAALAGSVGTVAVDARRVVAAPACPRSHCAQHAVKATPGPVDVRVRLGGP